MEKKQRLNIAYELLGIINTKIRKNNNIQKSQSISRYTGTQIVVYVCVFVYKSFLLCGTFNAHDYKCK